MYQEERQYIGMGCFACLSSKPELLNDGDDRRIRLSVTEYKILSCFIKNANKPVYLEELARFVWGVNYEADQKDPDSLRSNISRLRSKLEKIQTGLSNSLDTNNGLRSYTFVIKDSDNHTNKTIPAPPAKESVTPQRSYPEAFDVAKAEAKRRSVLQKEKIDLTGLNIHSEAELDKLIIQCAEEIIRVAGVDGLSYSAYYGFKYPVALKTSHIEKVNEAAMLSHSKSVMGPYTELKKTMDSIVAAIPDNETVLSPVINVDGQEYIIMTTIMTREGAYFVIANETDCLDYLIIKAVTEGLKVHLQQLDTIDEFDYVCLCARLFTLKQIKQIAFEK